MAEEDVVVAITSPPVDLKRKLDEVVETEVPEPHAGSDDGSNGISKTASDSPQAKRPKLDDDDLDNGKTQENGSPVEERKEEMHEESSKAEETEKPSADDIQDSEPLVEDSIHAQDSEFKTCGIDQPAEDTLQTSIEAPISQENTVEEECKDDVNGAEQNDVNGAELNDVNGAELNDVNGGELNDVNGAELNDGTSQKDIGDKQVDGENPQKVADDDTQSSTTRRIDVPSSKVGVLIGKGGETIRNLQFNSGAKIQILRDSEADPNSASRPVEIIGTVACIENAQKLINAVVAEAEAGGSPALVARGHPATHAIGIPEQIEIKVPNDKVGLIIGRGGETIKNMQTRSGARIQLIPQHAEGDGFKERTVRISGDKRQIDIATDMIKEVMYQNARPSPYSGGYNQHAVAYRPRGPGGPPQWGSRGPYDYHHQRGPYSSHGQGQHYNPQGYPPQHMPPRSGYWDQQRPSHSGPYDYYGPPRSQNSGPLPPPSGPGPAPPSQVNYGYGQSHHGHAPPYSQTSHQQSYGYEQPPKYDNNPQPYGGSSYPPMQQQPGGRPYGGMQQGPVQQGYGPPRPPAAGGDVPYQGPTPAAAPSYGNTQQQYGYGSSGGPVQQQQQTYPSYNSAPPTDGYNNGTQTPATAPAYQQQNVQPGHDQAQAAATGYGGGYSSYPSAYANPQSGNYGYNQDPNYGYATAPGSQPAYSQAPPSQTGYEQQPPATQPAGKTQSPQSAYAQYDASQVYAAPR